MDIKNKHQYQQESSKPNKKPIKLPGLEIFLLYLFGSGIIAFLFTQWCNQIPRIAEYQFIDSVSNDPIHGVAMKFNSKELQSYDNVLITTLKKEGDIQEQITQNNGIMQLSSGTIEISICNSTTYNLTCASMDQIAEILQSPIEVEITVSTLQYDYSEMSFYSIAQRFIFYIYKNTQQIGYITLKRIQYEIDTNLIVKNSEIHNDNAEAQLQFSSINSASYTLARFQLQYDPTYRKRVIVYDKLYVLLLQIVSVLFFCQCLQRLIQCFINVRRDKIKLMKIIQIYFPQLQEYKIKFNLFGKIVKVSSLENEKRSVKLMSAFFEKYYESARKKMKIKNIIYTLSRLQFVCQSLQDRDTMMNVNQVGIRLNLQQEVQNETSLTTEMMEVEDPLVLRGSDMDLLSRQNGLWLMGMCSNAFYKKNQKDVKGKFCLI